MDPQEFSAPQEDGERDDAHDDAQSANREAAATSNPDPEEQLITGLEPGGSVPPGETPPGEGSMSQDQGHGE